MKLTPAPQCASMKEVRKNIDDLDAQLIEMLGKRLSYIRRAAEIKADKNTIRDEERIESMLLVRGELAQQQDYDAQFMMDLFRQLINYSVDYEMGQFLQKESST